MEDFGECFARGREERVEDLPPKRIQHHRDANDSAQVVTSIDRRCFRRALRTAPGEWRAGSWAYTTARRATALPIHAAQDTARRSVLAVSAHPSVRVRGSAASLDAATQAHESQKRGRHARAPD